MLDVIIVCTLILIPFLLICVFKINDSSLLRPNIFTIIFWMFLIFSYIGLIPLYLKLDEYRVRIGIVDTRVILEMVIYASIAFVVLSISYLVLNNILLKNKTFEKVEYKSMEISTLPIIILTILCILVFTLYLIQIENLPIIAQLIGEPKEIVMSYRSQATNAFSGNLHYYTMFMESGLIISSCFFLGKSLTSKTFIWRLIFIIVFLVTVFYSIHTTEKAPVIWYLISLLVTYLLIKGKIFNLKYVASLGILTSIILFFFYKFFMDMKTYSNFEIISSVFSRTFSGQLTPAYYYLELFPESISFLNGVSFPNPGGFLSFEHYNLPREIYRIKFSELSAEGIVGSAPAPFWGEAYANFGVVGIIISAVYVAIIIILIESIFINFNKNILTISIYVALIMQLKNIAVTGVSSYIFNLDIIFIIFISILLIITSYPKFVKNRYNNLS